MSGRLSKIVVLIGAFAMASCEGDIFITFHFSGLELENAVNTGEMPVVTSADSIPKEAYVLRLNLFPVETAREGRYLDQETPPHNTNPVDSIFVTSDLVYNDSLPAGALLNDFFLIFNANYLNTSSLSNPQITNVYSDNFYDQPYPEYVDLLMMVPPDTMAYRRFYVRVVLEDGTQFLDSTIAVKLY